ncbi:MAG TPA: hypothetical protein VN205_03325 [Thermomonas sp.]|nr:hypothetical protein [Thermomonas sp.]
MEELWARFADNMLGRVSGPMHFRLLLQPVMATVFAFIAGRADAKAGKAPYFWSLLTDPGHRRDMLKDGWKDVGKVFLLAILLDVVYQYIVAKFIYPGEALVVAFLLAIVPYLLVRGVVTRLFRHH